MINMNMRKAEFSDKQWDLAEAGVELYKNYLYNKDPKKFGSFKNFSADISYEKKNEKFREAIIKECYEVANLDPAKYTVKKAFTFPQFERAHFAVIEEVIRRTTAKSMLEQFMGRVAEVRNMADGDSLNIDIRAKNVYILSKVSRGRNSSHIQRHYGQNVVLSPTPRQVTVGFEIHQIAGGRFDYGREIALATEGIQTSLLNEVQSLVFSTSNPIANKLLESSYSEAAFRSLCQRVQAFNGGGQTMVFGTEIALGNVLPSNTNFLQDLGEDYMNYGYLTNLFGYRAMRFPQAVDADYDAILPNDKLVIMTSGVDTPIKIGMEGDIRIIQTQDTQSADRVRSYTVETAWDVQLASDAHIGIQTV